WAGNQFRTGSQLRHQFQLVLSARDTHSHVQPRYFSWSRTPSARVHIPINGEGHSQRSSCILMGYALLTHFSERCCCSEETASRLGLRLSSHKHRLLTSHDDLQ